MSSHQKMKLDELQPKAVDVIDWNILDSFFYQDAPNALNKSLLLTNIIKQLDVLNIPEVDGKIVISYLSKMSKDTAEMSTLLASIRSDYDIKKQRYQGNYNENAHMYSLTVAHDMQDWLEQYENTIAQSIEDVVNYINSVVPADKTIQITQ